MHRPKYFVDTVFIKTVRIFLLQNRVLKLFQKLPILKQVHIQHVFRIKSFSHILLLFSIYLFPHNMKTRSGAFILKSAPAFLMPVRTGPD